jgi:hypothetical protein
MRAYHLLISSAASVSRRVDFYAESPDHAFQIARNEEVGIDVELWEGDRILARMTKSGANIWKLVGSGSVNPTYGRGRSNASA